jgi:hypothetical protein
MPVSNALKRLLRIRDLEQEQHRLALESALSELRRLEAALGSASERERRGRGELAASVRAGEQQERHPALVESEIGNSHARVLAPRIVRVEAETARRRQAFLLKRLELRQAETLIRETEAADEVEELRKGQQRLDEWYLSRVLREEPKEASPGTPTGK